MRRAGLDLAAVRGLSPARPSGTGEEPDGRDTVSRRQALGLAGVAAVGASPVLRAVETLALGSYTLASAGQNRVAFSLGGQERWVIDTKQFAGTPRLTVKQTASRVRVELAGARYAGTDLSADFRCVIRRGNTLSRMTLRMTLGGFSGSVPFEPWLVGLASLGSPVRLPHLPCALSADASLLLDGMADATYAPDWTTELQGQGIGVLKGVGAPLVTDTVLVALPGPVVPSLLNTPSPTRATLALQRGERTWHVTPAFQPNGLWRLAASSGAFDLIRLEFGEDRTGRRTGALVAEAGQPLAFYPHHGLKGTTGKAFALHLSGARYAVAFDPGGDHTALVARFHAQPAWLMAGGCAVEVGDAPDAPAFEMQAQGGRVTAVDCTPAVLRVAAPIAGAVVEPTLQAAGTHLAFVTKGMARPDTPHAARLELSAHPGDLRLRFTLINPRFAVLRTDDLLALTFEFIGLKLDASAVGKPPVMRPLTIKRPGYLAVHIQGQNIAEQAFFRVQPETPVPTTSPGPGQPPDPDATLPPTPGGTAEFPEGRPFVPVDKRLADESRLVFALPTGSTEFPLTLDTLLDWSRLTPSVPPTALPAGEFTTAHIAEPQATETSLEVPWRLKISPNRHSGWVHAFSPVTRAGRTELWHTRLGVKVTTTATATAPGHTYLVDQHYLYEARDTPDGRTYAVTGDTYRGGKPVDVVGSYRTVRAVWSQDYPTANRLPDNKPFRSSLTGQDRYDLVKLTSFFGRAKSLKRRGIIAPHLLAVAPPSYYNPLPVQINRLMLTTLGAWIDVHGAWSQGYHLGIGLEEWTHRGTQGRDHYVRVVYKGYLFPFGHRASLIKITERKFYVQGGRNIAYLFQRMFIIVREPVKQFGGSGLKDSDGRSIDRAMPFKTIQITTTTTPDIDPPHKIPGVGSHATDAFWPQIGGKDFLFHCIGQDQDGQRTEFTAPLAFIGVENFVAYDPGQMTKVEGFYKSTSGTYPTRHRRPTNGAKVAFAPSNRPGDTTLHAVDVTFDAFVPPGSTPLPDDQPRFYPMVKSATVGIPAVEALLHSGQKPQIKLSDHYLKNDLGGSQNAGEVFAEIIDAARPKVTFGGSNSGGTGTPGVVSPSLAISALSRVMGPVGGDTVDQVAGGNVPDVGAFLQQFFDNDAKILGAVPLSSIIKLPSLTPVFKVLSLVQSIESAPDALNELVTQAVGPLQGNLAGLSAQARADLQSQLAPLRSALGGLKSPLDTLHTALTSLPGIVTDLLGDVNTVIADLGTLVADLSTLLADLDTLLADLGAANVGALGGDVSALKTPLTAFPTDLKKLVDDLSNLQGLNPLPLLKHAQLPTALDTTLTWSPHLKSFPPFTAVDKFLSVTARVHIPFDGAAPSFKIVGTLGKIGIDLADIIHVGFGGLTFSASSGEKPDVTAGGVEVLFTGPLAFVNDLKDAIPSSGFNDPPFVDITSDGVSAGFTFDLPSIGVGIFSLENISLGAKVTIPFIGSSPAQVYFNFCTREHPFILTISMLGGGGFFGISLGLDGLDMLEASFEFGAELSLDFGIASGSVSIMAGIYFKMEKSPHDQTILTGFVHIHGEVEALEILSVSIDVELDLTYEKDGHDTKVMGDATLTISVHVLFFSVTVSASVHREFSGSHNDPTFADQVSEHDWNAYLKAFA